MANLDCSIQVRLDRMTLATAARFYFERGNMLALKNASALARYIIEDYVRMLESNEGAMRTTTTLEAEEVLDQLGIFPQTVTRSRMNNLRAQTGDEPRSWRIQQPTQRSESSLNGVESDAAMFDKAQRLLRAQGKQLDAEAVEEIANNADERDQNDLEYKREMHRMSETQKGLDALERQAQRDAIERARIDAMSEEERNERRLVAEEMKERLKNIRNMPRKKRGEVEAHEHAMEEHNRLTTELNVMLDEKYGHLEYKGRQQ